MTGTFAAGQLATEQFDAENSPRTIRREDNSPLGQLAARTIRRQSILSRNVCNNAHFTLFADDTTVICTDYDYLDLINKTNSALSILHEWTINNRLSFNR